MGDTQGKDGRMDHLNYVPHIAYNGTGPQGANPLEFDVNLWYEVRKSRSTSWLS